MKQTIAALLLIASTPVLAGGASYGEMTAKREMCQYAGEFGAEAWQNTQNKQPQLEITKDDIGYMYAAVKFAIEYGATAPDAKNAYMTAWSKCMDNAEYLLNYKKRTGTAADALHY